MSQGGFSLSRLLPDHARVAGYRELYEYEHSKRWPVARSRSAGRGAAYRSTAAQQHEPESPHTSSSQQVRTNLTSHQIDVTFFVDPPKTNPSDFSFLLLVRILTLKFEEQ